MQSVEYCGFSCSFLLDFYEFCQNVYTRKRDEEQPMRLKQQTLTGERRKKGGRKPGGESELNAP